MTRPEVTGRKLGVSTAQAKQAKQDDEEPQEPPKLLTFTIPQFCQAHGLSSGGYYNLRKTGKGPREMRVGMRVMISHEAAADWRVERENDTEAAESAAKSWAKARAGLYETKRKVAPRKTSKAAPTKPKRAAKFAARAEA